MTTIEQLAEELHRFYRAAFKALMGTTRNVGSYTIGLSSHDHGWSHCNKKKYFLRRAEILKRDLQLNDIITLHCGGCGRCLDCLRLERDKPAVIVETGNGRTLVRTREGLGHVGHD